jgi:hypothetical protein
MRNQDDWTSPEVIDRMVASGVRPPMQLQGILHDTHVAGETAGCIPEAIQKIIKWCWAHNPLQRPDINQVIDELSAALKTLPVDAVDEGEQAAVGASSEVHPSFSGLLSRTYPKSTIHAPAGLDYYPAFWSLVERVYNDITWNDGKEFDSSPFDISKGIIPPMHGVSYTLFEKQRRVALRLTVAAASKLIQRLHEEMQSDGAKRAAAAPVAATAAKLDFASAVESNLPLLTSQVRLAVRWHAFHRQFQLHAEAEARATLDSATDPVSCYPADSASNSSARTFCTRPLTLVYHRVYLQPLRACFEDFCHLCDVLEDQQARKYFENGKRVFPMWSAEKMEGWVSRALRERTL